MSTIYETKFIKTLLNMTTIAKNQNTLQIKKKDTLHLFKLLLLLSSPFPKQAFRK